MMEKSQISKIILKKCLSVNKKSCRRQENPERFYVQGNYTLENPRVKQSRSTVSEDTKNRHP